MRLYWIGLLLFSSCLFAGWDDSDDDDFDLDDDQLEESYDPCYTLRPKEIHYDGMVLFCDQGCAIRDCDPRIDNIWTILEPTLKRALDGIPLDYDWDGDHFYPWYLDPDSEQFEIYDWPTTGGFYKRNCRYQTLALQNHSHFVDLAALIRRDVYFYELGVVQKELEILKNILPRLYEEKDKEDYRYVEIGKNGKLKFYNAAFFDYYDSLNNTIPRIEKQILDFENSLSGWRFEQYEKKSELVEDAIFQIDTIFREIFQDCLQSHQIEGIAFQGALEDFLGGDYEQAIAKIRWMIDLAEQQKTSDKILAKLYFLKGQIQSEFCLYADAIIDLTQAIQKNPEEKEAFFERAFAYLELGQIDQAAKDYLNYGKRPPIKNLIELDIGMTAGMLEGLGATAKDFVPSMWGAVRNIGEGLWAFSQSPVQGVRDVTQAALNCIEFFRSASLSVVAQSFVPELKQLLKDYDTLSDFQKGQQMGFIIGKYGSEILCAKYSVKAIKAYAQLKKANRMATLDAFTHSEKKQLSIAVKKALATRDQLRKDALKIALEKQGKHIPGHKNYERLIAQNQKPSILTHPDPQLLVEMFAGAGIQDGKIIAGVPGSREIVNCKEIIGYVVDKQTGKKNSNNMV